MRSPLRSILFPYTTLFRSYPESYVGKVQQIVIGVPGLDWSNFLVGISTLLTLVFWKKISRFPPHIPALLIGVGVAWLFSSQGHSVDTIGNRFSYLLPDGSTGAGIPPYLPQFVWPWLQPSADGNPIGFSWSLLENLLPA